MNSLPTGLWLVAGALLVVLVGAGGLLGLRSRNARRRSPAGTGGRFPGGDDLPGFLDSPPGSAGTPGGPPAAPPARWPALAGPPPAEPAGSPAVSGRSATVLLVAAGALALTGLLALAAVLLLDPRPGRSGSAHGDTQHDQGPAGPMPSSPAPGPGQSGAGTLADVSVRPGRDGGAARLSFGGLVLEQRAVGITATYPSVDVTWNREEAVAHLRLPTYNCLTTAAPQDPLAAGCAPSLTEYADLTSPALTVTGDDGRVRLSGRFPTYVRPNGSSPEWTGRVYELSLRAAPAAGRPDGGWVRAEGEIRLGAGSARTLDTSEVTARRGD